MGAATETAMRPLNAGPAEPRAQSAAPAASGSKGGSAGLRIVKFFIALALIPACIGLSMGIDDHFTTLMTRINVAFFGPNTLLKWFAGGAVGFGIFAVLLWRPVVLYVFGHELVHAFATWLCLGKVSNLTASASGGQVTTSKSNTFIRLAPYCVPFYALIVAAAYLSLDTWWRPLGAYTHIVAAMLGFFYTFHIGFTLWSLRRDQPDLKPDGWLFSLVIIYMANAVVFVLVLGFLFNGNPHGSWTALKDSCTLGWQHTQHIYHNVIAFVEQSVNR